jgi:GNAT superfamily N-acetyltransferase
MARMMKHSTDLRLLTAPDYPAFANHFVRQSAESGRHGLPHFMPFEAPPEPHLPARRDRTLARWAIPVGRPGWLAHWGIFEGARIIAHLDLAGPDLATAVHRVTLGIGVEHGHQRRGHGSRLIQTAIDFARAHGLAWIDLRVFADNGAAIALYRSRGFVETGRTVDCFRLHGRSIDDISMSLRL